MPELFIDELSRSNHTQVRALILAGLGERWGSVDPALNPDLDDMISTYSTGRTVVVRRTDATGDVVGTGTVIPRSGNQAEIVRMSVAASARRLGVGRSIVEELVTTARLWGCDRVVLETTSSWTDVVDFYLQCGFEITHTVDGDYGEDTWFEYRLNDQR